MAQIAAAFIDVAISGSTRSAITAAPLLVMLTKHSERIFRRGIGRAERDALFGFIRFRGELDFRCGFSALIGLLGFRLLGLRFLVGRFLGLFLGRFLGFVRRRFVFVGPAGGNLAFLRI